jgi:hypothetical protein
VGGLVVSVMPPSAAVLEWELLVDVRSSPTGRMLGLSVVILGLSLLAAAWLQLAGRARSFDTTDPDAGVALVRIAVTLWSSPLLIAPPLFSRDGWSYAAQGVLTHLGLSPYEHGPGDLVRPGAVPGPIVQAVDLRWMDTLTPYGPVPLILGDLAANITTGPWSLVIAHRFIAIIGLVLLAWAVPRLARWCGMGRARASALALASPLMIANGVGGLHNDLLMVGLMAAALVLAHERHWLWGAVLGGLAAGVKLPGGLICVAVVLVTLPAAAPMAQRMRRLVEVGMVSLAALALPGVVWGLGIGWIEALGVPGTVNTPLSLPAVFGGWLDLMARWFGLGLAPGTFLEAVRLIAQVGIVAVAVWVALRTPTGRGRHAVRAAAIVTGALIALSPVVHLWYFLWVMPFLAALPLSRPGARAFYAVSVLAGLVAPMDSSLHRAYLSIVVGSMLIAAASLVLMVVNPSRGVRVPSPRRASDDRRWSTERNSAASPGRRRSGTSARDPLP